MSVVTSYGRCSITGNGTRDTLSGSASIILTIETTSQEYQKLQLDGLNKFCRKHISDIKQLLHRNVFIFLLYQHCKLLHTISTKFMRWMTLLYCY